jgi:hypothetical protein
MSYNVAVIDKKVFGLIVSIAKKDALQDLRGVKQYKSTDIHTVLT